MMFEDRRSATVRASRPYHIDLRADLMKSPREEDRLTLSNDGKRVILNMSRPCSAVTFEPIQVRFLIRSLRAQLKELTRTVNSDSPDSKISGPEAE